jgi:uncharacterized protein YdhG (YjbR/CyaY superfamily)
MRTSTTDSRSTGLEETMAKTNFRSVDEYIATHPEDVQPILQRVRSTIRKAVPGAQEVISYQLPAYKLPAGPVLAFAGWKQPTRSMAPPIASSQRSRTTLHRTRSARARSASRSPSLSPSS